jgi:integral membrane protein (TIGR01906 family)
VRQRTIATVVRIVLLVCTPLLLLLSNLYLVATPAFIRHEYGKADFAPADVFTSSERHALAEATLHYLRSDQGLDYLASLSTEGRSVYNQREVKHLMDVKVVMRGAFLVQGVCFVLAILALFLSWSQGLWSVALRAVYQGCCTLITGLAVIGFTAYFSFDLFFTAFHRVFFSGDSWLFAFSDTLIQLFPVVFWMDATWTLALLAVGESIALGCVVYVLYRRGLAR